jgi:hypothetical protein
MLMVALLGFGCLVYALSRHVQDSIVPVMDVDFFFACRLSILRWRGKLRRHTWIFSTVLLTRRAETARVEWGRGWGLSIVHPFPPPPPSGWCSHAVPTPLIIDYYVYSEKLLHLMNVWALILHVYAWKGVGRVGGGEGGRKQSSQPDILSSMTNCKPSIILEVAKTTTRPMHVLINEHLSLGVGPKARQAPQSLVLLVTPLSKAEGHRWCLHIMKRFVQIMGEQYLCTISSTQLYWNMSYARPPDP